MVTLLVDGQWNLKRNFFKKRNYSANGELCGGSYGFLDSLRSTLTRTMPDKVFVAWDGLNGGKLRYDIYKPYKAKRKKFWATEDLALENDGGTNKSDQEKYELIKQKLLINDFLHDLYVRQLEVYSIEADDLIAHYILNSKDVNEKIIIYSRDGDYFQLVSDKVSIINPDSLELITIDNFKEKFGYVVENALLFKCFKGDSSDGILGVNGVTIANLIKHFPRMADEKYTFDRLVEECYDKKRTKKLKLFDKIINSREILYRNAKLINLKQPFVNEEVRREMVDILEGALSEDREVKNAMSLFFNKGFSTFVRNDQIDLFFAPFYRLMNKEQEFKINKK